jgi:hypothetical protein
MAEEDGCRRRMLQTLARRWPAILLTAFYWPHVENDNNKTKKLSAFTAGSRCRSRFNVRARGEGKWVMGGGGGGNHVHGWEGDARVMLLDTAANSLLNRSVVSFVSATFTIPSSLTLHCPSSAHAACTIWREKNITRARG